MPLGAQAGSAALLAKSITEETRRGESDLRHISIFSFVPDYMMLSKLHPLKGRPFISMSETT